MYQTVFKETWLHLARSSKNRLTIGLVFLAILFYSFILLPQRESFDTIDYQQLEINRNANRGLMEEARENGNFQVNGFTGQSAFSQAKYNYDYQNALLESIQTGNAERYMGIISTYLPEFHTDERLEKYLNSSLYPEKDLTYDEINFHNRIRSYQEEQVPLTFSIIQEKTSLQQLYLFLLELGPTILVILALFIAADVFIIGVKKRTQHIGVPLSWGRYLFVQSLATLSFVFLFFLAAAGFFFLINGLLYGFGSRAFQVPQFIYSEEYVTDMSVYRLMKMSTFFLQSLPFVAILIYLFIRLTALFSLLFRQEVVVFLAGIFTFLFERLYYSRTTRQILGMDVSYFPQTYFDFGKVITGEKNFLLNTGTITPEKGLISLIVTVLVVELLLVAATRWRTRQKFIG